jgi:hypothetical protein
MRPRKVGTARRFTRQRRSLKRLGVAACLAALSLAANPLPTTASVTIGRLAPNASILCPAGDPGYDYAQLTVTSGNAYVVPGAGTITSWSHNARSGSNQTLTMKMFRKVADPAFYEVVGHDGPHPLAANLLNTFPASIPVKPGDILGLHSGGAASTACYFSAPGESYRVKAGNLNDGQGGSFGPGSGLLNISAVFVPSNTFTLGKTKLNKKKGTAALKLTLPNSGELTGSGKGVQASAGRAEISKSVSAGPAQLLIKAKGKKKRKLNDTGKVKLNVAITFTPTGGDPSRQSVKVKLKKNL